MLQALGEDAKCQDFSACHGFITTRPIRQNTWQLWHLGEPTTIFFAVTLNIKLHSCLRIQASRHSTPGRRSDAQRNEAEGRADGSLWFRSPSPARPLEREVRPHP